MAGRGVPMPGMGMAFGGTTKPISRIVFDRHDKDGNGTLDKAELKDMCYEMGHYMDDTELEIAYKYLDKDGSGTITYEEFLAWWRQEKRFEKLKLDDEAAVERRVRAAAAFAAFDKDRSGVIETKEFGAFYAYLKKYKLTTMDEKATLTALDANGDGQIAFNEWIDFYEGSYEQSFTYGNAPQASGSRQARRSNKPNRTASAKKR